MPARTFEHQATRTHILSAVGDAQIAAEDARWAALGYDWTKAQEAVREALVALSKASSLLAAAGSSYSGPEMPEGTTFPKEISG